MSAARKEPKKADFESSLRRLEEIVHRLEGGELPLEESLRMYEEGIQLSRTCLEQLTQVELRLKTLTKNTDGTFRLVEGEPEDEAGKETS